MEITAFRPTRTITAEFSEAQAPRANPLSFQEWHEIPGARRISLLRIALAVSGMLVLPQAASPLAVIMLLYVLHGLLVHWAATVRNAATRSRAWHWIDLGWGLAVVAASGADSFTYLFFLYPIVVASLRSGSKEGAAVTLAAIAGWLAVGLLEGTSPHWHPVLMRAASLAILGYAIALSAGFAAARQQRLRALAEMAVDSERRKISLDLHDGALQPYLGLKLGLEALRRKVEPGNALAHEIDELYRMTQESIAELRGYVRVLGGRPRERAVDVAAALRRPVERFQSFYGLTIDLELLCEGTLNEQLAEEVVQMVSESLSNIGRHTASQHVTVTLATAEHEFVMRIVDDGGGRKTAWRHFTPVSLTLRARRLGGRVEVAPHGGGTEVCIAIPI